MKFIDKKVVLFDLDGTLIDSVPDIAVAVNAMLESLGYPTYSEEKMRSWVGNGAKVLVKRALSGDVKIDETLSEDLFSNAYQLFLDFYMQNVCKDTRLYPTVQETLETLKNKGYRLAIVTNKPYAFVAPILDTLGLNGLFETYIGGDTLSLKKPDPMPLVYMCDQLNISVDKALMVGDSKNDILAAKAAGMQSIGVTYGYNYGEAIEVYDPEVVVDLFSDILDSLSE